MQFSFHLYMCIKSVRYNVRKSMVGTVLSDSSMKQSEVIFALARDWTGNLTIQFFWFCFSWVFLKVRLNSGVALL